MAASEAKTPSTEECKEAAQAFQSRNCPLASADLVLSQYEEAIGVSEWLQIIL